MSLSDIPTILFKKKKTRNKWSGDQSDSVIKKIYPPLEELLRVKKTPDGVPLQNLSDARIKIILIISGMSGGKSKLVDYIISEGIKEYGNDLVNVRVSRDMYSLIGKFDKESHEFYGGQVSTKPVNIFVHDDALSQLGTHAKKGVLDTFDAIFNNTRHLVKYEDDYGNKKGLIVIILNMQDLHTLAVSARKNWTMVIYKTLVKNDQNFIQFKARIPKEGLEILEDNTKRLDDEDPDETYKNDNVVDFGFGKWGYFKSELVAEAWCYDGSPYWADHLPTNNEEFSSPAVKEIKETISGNFSFVELKDELVDKSMIDKILQYGKKNPKKGRKYSKNPEKYWEAAYRYWVKEESPGYICGEIFGLEGDTMLTNGYNKGGYTAIVIREQWGYWVEPFIPELIDDIKWFVIAEQATSDMVDEEAKNSRRLGIGLHAEIKSRRKKETPQSDWVSTDMAAHLKHSGKAKMYQFVVRRINEKMISRLITYDVIYHGNDKIIPYVPIGVIANGNGHKKNSSRREIDKILDDIDFDDFNDLF